MKDREKVISVLIELGLCPDRDEAVKWYTREPLPGLGNMTAEQLVRDGKIAAVLDYLKRVEDGGYA